ncbi:MAG: hypothetical protein IPJ34_37695 [Myxococcales bacterium]|nr:hypothetical protein [Myxococcales bacterium]
MKRLLLAFAVSAVACDSLPRSLDEDECRGWAEHYLKLAKVSAREHAVACGKEAAAKDTLVERMGKSAEEAVEKDRDPFLGDCRKSVGKKYAVEEKRCFLEAKHARDWAKCAFKIDVLFHVKDADKDLQKREGLSCLQFLENNEGKK